MKTHTITTYLFSELSETAKENAIQEYLNGDREYFWTDEGIESIRAGLDFFGAKLGQYQIGPYCYSYADFSHTEQNEISGVRLRTFILNNFYTAFFTKEGQGKYIKRTGKFANTRYSKIKLVKSSCPFTGYCVDDSFLQPMHEFLARPQNITFQELLENCVNSAIKDIILDMEYQDSEEFAKSELIELEYEFTENGNFFNPKIRTK